MGKTILNLVVAATLTAASAAHAADLTTPMARAAPYCALAQNAQILSIPDNARLTTEVVRLMDEAVAVSQSHWINSSRPVFVWASEAKVACGIAYGYLRSHYRDHEFLNKCECFHTRMIQYMH